MHIEVKPLKSLSTVSLTSEEGKLLSWLRSAPWQPVSDAREPTLRAKVPEFFGGVRLYIIQGGGPQGRNALDLLIKKLEYQGVLSRQDMYPVQVEGAARYVSLKASDVANLKAQDDDDDE